MSSSASICVRVLYNRGDKGLARSCPFSSPYFSSMDCGHAYSSFSAAKIIRIDVSLTTPSSVSRSWSHIASQSCYALASGAWEWGTNLTFYDHYHCLCIIFQFLPSPMISLLPYLYPLLLNANGQFQCFSDFTAQIERG